MMGTTDGQPPLFCVGVDVDDRIPRDHPLRLVKQQVDFSFVRREVSDLYGRNGNVSIDPEVILKLLFLLFFDDVKSERELMRQVGYRLDYLWFLDLSLDQEVPNHSVLSKARRRWGVDVFERVFVRTVQQCVEAGLIDGQKVHADATLVDADASKDSIKKGSPQLIEALRRVFAEQEAKLDQLNDEQQEDPDKDDTEGSGGPANQTVNASMVRTTDPDAEVCRQRGGESRPRYKHHRVVDDAHGVITAIDTTARNVDEGKLLLPLIEQHERHTEQQVKTAIADSKYGTVDNFVRCQEREIQTHMSDLKRKQANTGRRKDIFAEQMFTYDEVSDTYRCPAGQTLHRRNWYRKRQTWEYITGRGVCDSCALRSRCTRSKTGRTIKRQLHHTELERARRQSCSVLAYRDRRRRKHLMEGSFAQGANLHHLKRSHWRRLWRQKIQDALIASVQNVKILVTHARKNRRRVISAAMCPHSVFCRRIGAHWMALCSQITFGDDRALIAMRL